MSLFEYCDLDRSKNEIRLLTCLTIPDNVASSTEIYRTCCIQHVSLDQQPEFVALSYTWGPKDPPCHLYLVDDAQRRQGIIPITENLAHGLEELIKTTGYCLLWIDAICIDQENREEKSWQVALMQRIYQAATSVFIWLGPDEDGCESAMAHLDEVGRQICEEQALLAWEMRYWLAQFWGSSLPQSALNPVKNGYKNIELLLKEYPISNELDASIPYTKTVNLLQRPWWQRVWVLQEIVLPAMKCLDSNDRAGISRIIFGCGQTRSNLHSMAAALTLFRLSVVARVGKLYQAEYTETMWLDRRPFWMLSARSWIQKVPLVRLLTSTSNYSSTMSRLCASDPRDRIFALLSVCSDANDLGIVPDYSKSPQIVYVESMTAIIRLYGLSCVLLFAHFPKRLENLPSWVPDWSAGSQGYLIYSSDSTIEFGFDKLLGNVQPPFEPWAAGKSFVKDVSFVYGSNAVLRIKGVRVGVLSSIVPDAAWQGFLKTTAQILKASRAGGDVNALYSSDYTIPRTEEELRAREATVRRLESRIALSFPHEEIADKCSVIDQELLGTNSESLCILSEALKLRPYAELKRFNLDATKPMIRSFQRLHSELRSLVQAHSKGYPDAKSLENAVWRTPVADQAAVRNDGWDRPSQDVSSSLIFFNAWAEWKPDGFDNLVADAELERKHHILTTSGMFADDLKMETVKYIAHSPKNVTTIALFLDKGEIRMGVTRHEGDRKPDGEYWSILFKPLDELAVILCELNGLPGRNYSDKSTAGRDLFTGRIQPKEIADAVYAEVGHAFEIDDNQMVRLFNGAWNYLLQASASAIGRKVFAMDGGYLGLGPQHMQLNDVVVAWPSIPSLVVLRPLKNGRYLYVGEAYVHGAMDGQLTTGRPVVEFHVE